MYWSGKRQRAMNPSLPAELVADALAEDEESATAEYLAEFRRDIERFPSLRPQPGPIIRLMDY